MAAHDKAIKVIPRKFSGEFPEPFPPPGSNKTPILVLFLYLREKVASSRCTSYCCISNRDFIPARFPIYLYVQEFLNSAVFQAVSAEYEADERLKKN
jgi:hypothetical protein